MKKEALVAVGSERLADVILSLYEENKDIQKQLDIVFAGLEENPKKLISLIKKEISSIKRSKKFIDYYAYNDFVDQLERVRHLIVNHLRESFIEHAQSLMLLFLDLHKSVFERVDDSNGAIAGVFVEACDDLGKMYEQSPIPEEDLVDIIFTRFMKDDYGIYGSFILCFKNALTKGGANLLKKKLEEVPQKGDKFDRQYREYKISDGLKMVADCQKDVDAYIQVCQRKDKLVDNDYLEISKRLIDQWRSEEALQWLDKANDRGRGGEFFSLKIQALELLGEYSKAHDIRLHWFESFLSSNVYGQILKNTKPESKEAFKKQALKIAFSFPSSEAALSFLMEIQEFEEMAKFVCLRISDLCGRSYSLLRPVAKILEDSHPLVATFLYRKMVQPILEDAQYNYYNYAVLDLLKCKTLSSKIPDWGDRDPHEKYFKELFETHARKKSFWGKYESAFSKIKV